MEYGSVDFGDPALVTQLILPIDAMFPLPHKQDLQNPLCHVVVRPFLMDFFAGVEESCLGRSIGAYASGEPRHDFQLLFVRCQVFPGIFYTYSYLE